MSISKLSKTGKFLIYLTLFLPLAIVPFTIWEFVFIRNIIFYAFTAALLVLSIFYLKKKNSANFASSPLFWAILAFIGVRILSGIFGVDPGNSFFGSESRMDGNLGYAMLLGWLMAVLLFFDSKEWWNKLFKISSIVALISSLFAIIQAFFLQGGYFLSGKDPLNSFWIYRLIGTLGNPIFFAGYILPHIFLSAFLALKETDKKYKYFWIVLSVFFVLTVLLTRTRGAIISLFATSVFLAIIGGAHLLKNNKKLFAKSAMLGLPVLILVALVSKFVLWTRLASIFLLSDTAATRLLLWKVGFIGFLDKWLFGWGPENYSYIFSKFYNPMSLKYSFYETWGDKPHNQFVEILSTTGILGFIAFVAIIFLASHSLWRLMKAESFNKLRTSFLPYLLISGGIISYTIHIFFAFDTLESRMIFFLLLGFIIFSQTASLNISGKILVSTAKKIFWCLLLITAVSFYFIGAKTIKAAHYANLASEGLANNEYGRATAYFEKLKGIDGPYQSENWEILSDVVLKSDAAGRIPLSVIRQLLPAVIHGLGEAAKANPENFSYHFRLGQMYNLAGTYIDRKYLDNSVEELLSAKKISPKRQVVDLALAQVYYAKRDTESAIKLLEDLVKANENISPEPYWYLGLFYDADGQFDKSYAYMSTAVDKGYNFKGLNEEVLYVGVLGRQKDYARMAPVYESIVAKQGDNPAWWANLATVYLELKRYEDARKAARQAIFLDPKFGDEGKNFLKKVDKAEGKQ